jgi:ABC-2 type transport system permease protein
MPSVKALIMARREYIALVRTKGFLIGLILAPALMVALVATVPTSGSRFEGGPREIALIDHTGRLQAPLMEAARAVGLKITTPPLLGGGEEQARLESDVRYGSLAALVVVKSKAISGPSSDPDAQVVLTVRNIASHSALWLQHALDDVIQLQRLTSAGVEPKRAQEILSPVRLDVRLPESGEAGTHSAVTGAIAPLYTLILVFLAIMSSAPYMLHSVVEEKQQRIAEVLLGSMSPFDLMAGKLLGAAGAGLTVVAAYAAVGLLGASRYGLEAVLSPAVMLMSLADVLLALVMFGSLFLAAGAAATELKDAQGLMTPLTLVMIVPMMAVSQLLGNPDGALAVGLSLFPLTAPMVLPLRLATTSVPAWQIVISVFGALVTTTGIVWVAGRIFRIGILAQGRSPRFSELWQWIRSG